MPITKEFQAKVDLLLLLTKPGVPSSLFKEVWDWAKDVQDSGVTLEEKTTRNSIVKQLCKRYDMSGEAPTEKKVVLPESGVEVKLVLHDFLPSLYSLLNDNDLMQDENLIFNGDVDPFQKPPPGPHSVDFQIKDINDAQLYRDAFETHVLVPGTDLLVPLILFIDKTHVDEKGTHRLEPVSFTLGIFKKEVRALDHAWRPLGYVMNQSNIKAEVDAVQKARDYHFVLKEIFASLAKVQHSAGVAWNISYHGQNHDCTLKLPILCVVGDTEGHDMMCGHYQNRSNSRSFCRSCNCPAEETGLPKELSKAKRKFTKASDIQHLVKTNNLARLKALSYHPIDNAFSDLIFCDPVQGINGATPGELMHVVQHGMFLYFTKALFQMKRAKKQQKRKRESHKSNLRTKKRRVEPDEDIAVDDDEEDDDDDDLSEPGDEDKESDEELDNDHQYTSRLFNDDTGGDSVCRVGLFTKKACAQVDILAKFYGRRLSHQSDRSFDRAFFANGITSEAKKFAQRENCVLLLLLIILTGYQGAEFFDKHLPSECVERLVEVIESLLLFEHFLSEPQVTKRDVNLVRKYVPEMLKDFYDIINRKDGLGINLIKFHLPLHLYDDLNRFGPAVVFWGKTGETNHKSYKEAAKHTQMNSSNLEIQTAKHVTEGYIVNRAKREFRAEHISPVVSPTGEEITSDPTAECEAACWYIDEDDMFNIKKKKKNDPPTTAQWADHRLKMEVTSFIQDNIMPHLTTKKVVLFRTVVRKDGSTSERYRADPNYKTGYNSGWHDWSRVYFGEDDGFVPCRTIVFMQLDETVNTPSIHIKKGQPYGLVQSAIQDIYKKPNDLSQRLPSLANQEHFRAHQNSRLMYYAPLCCTESTDKDEPFDPMRRPILYPINVAEAYDSPVIAVPYEPCPSVKLADDKGIDWLTIEPKNKWLHIFCDIMKEKTTKRKK